VDLDAQSQAVSSEGNRQTTDVALDVAVERAREFTSTTKRLRVHWRWIRKPFGVNRYEWVFSFPEPTGGERSSVTSERRA
jgi:hypothetical protein